uniref:Uncharacterized protein n=1 Tax=Candidatus Kentrum sp. TUN TaxID=2126343 RepID=A0A450ZL58_9GAMM|nr:MAG: hypothetical protein BECKTUN1418D_GA0071000_102317 [Candidatus Kentron sp. TUN]
MQTFTVYLGYVDLDRQSVIIDIKQRAILSSKDPDSARRRICAEPNPDALSGYKAKGGATIDGIKGSIGGDVNVTLDEKATTVGERSQTVQLLRDSAYRICEAYINGAINEFEYQQFLRKYQKNAVTLLAIEQLSKSMLIPKSGCIGKIKILKNRCLEKNTPCQPWRGALTCSTTAKSKTLSDTKISTDAIKQPVGESNAESDMKIFTDAIKQLVGQSTVDESIETSCWGYLSRISSSTADEGTELKEPCLSYLKAVIDNDKRVMAEY